MNDYLFNTDLILVVSVVSTLLCAAFGYRLLHGRLTWRGGAVALGSALLLLGAEVLSVSRTTGLQNIPAAAYYLAFAADLLLACVVLSWKRGKTMVLGLGAFISVCLLLALTINSFYQYFPTIGSLFQSSYRKTATTSTLATNHPSTAAFASIETNFYGAAPNQGSVSAVAIPGSVSHLAARDAYVYLPPAYGDPAFATVHFPVLILLTGTPGNPSSWLQSGIFMHTMNDFAGRHHGIAPIVVIADHSGSFWNDTECLDSPHGNAETYLTVDVPAFMQQHYRAATDPENWGIGGFSEGGMCAAMLTLEHQDIFRHFLDMSGEPAPYLNDQSQTLPVLFNGSRTAQKEHNVDWLLTHVSVQPHLTAQFAIGANDNKVLISQMRQSYHEASQRKITTSMELIGNQGHSFNTWSRAYADALPKLSYYLGATSCETGCVQ